MRPVLAAGEAAGARVISTRWGEAMDEAPRRRAVRSDKRMSRDPMEFVSGTGDALEYGAVNGEAS